MKLAETSISRGARMLQIANSPENSPQNHGAQIFAQPRDMDRQTSRHMWSHLHHASRSPYFPNPSLPCPACPQPRQGRSPARAPSLPTVHTTGLPPAPHCKQVPHLCPHHVSECLRRYQSKNEQNKLPSSVCFCLAHTQTL